jgi:acyl-homoserine lactone acylase PvdQ
MRFIADLGDDEGFYLQLPAGESGHLLSGHYKDQWKDYYDGRPRRVSFSKPEGVSVLRLQPN